LLQDVRKLVTRMTIDAAKQLTADTRAVMHELKNLNKAIAFVKDIGTALPLAVNWAGIGLRSNTVSH